MLFLVGNVGEPIGYVFCVFPLVEFCLRPDFRVASERWINCPIRLLNKKHTNTTKKQLS